METSQVHRRSNGFVCRLFVVLLCLISPVVRAAEPVEEVDRLIRQLGAPAFSERDKAAERLIEMGEDARPLLKSALEDTGRNLSTEQRQRMEAILANGMTGLLETRSGLSQADIQMLRKLREKRIRGNDRWEVRDQISSVVAATDITDEGLALVVGAVVPNMPLTGQRGGGEPALDQYTAMHVLSAAADHEHAGQLTRAALAEWVRDWYVPYLTRGKGKADADDYYQYQSNQIATHLLMRDQLDADTFELLFKAFCGRAAKGTEADGHYQFAPTPGVVAGFSFSRHATYQHLGRLAQLLLVRAMIMRQGDHADDSSCEALGVVFSAPAMTDAQRRAGIETMLSAGGATPDWQALNLLLARLTNHDVWTDQDSAASQAGAAPFRQERLARDRWHQWWADNGATAALPAIEQDKAYRYLLVEVDVTQPDAPALKVIVDAELRPGQCYVARHPKDAGHICCVRARRLRFDPWQAGSGSASRRWPDAVLMDRLTCLPDGETREDRRPLRPGRARFSGPRHPCSCGQEEPIFNVELIHDLADGAGPSAGEVCDPLFWARRAVQTAVEFQQETAAADEGPLLAEFMEHKDGIRGLASYRARCVETALRDVLNHADPGIASSAALVLAGWKVEIETGPITALMRAENPQACTWAAEALALAGEPDGIRHLMRNLADDPSGEIHRALARLARESSFNAEQRTALAAELILAILPERETVEARAACEYLIVQQWAGQDFGYILGADPQENSAALQRCRQWARGSASSAPAEQAADGNR